jgi:2-polyprenyl-3-methyl-5-hydroxy-6-metoxy-1,4-benzoquinol methylase
MKKNIKNIKDFEKKVFSQKKVSTKYYNSEYFNSKWRKDNSSYHIDERRKIEGKNPLLIKKVFKPKKVLDMGCGPGALLYLLDEIGVNCYGIDPSVHVKKIAPKKTWKKIKLGSTSKNNEKDKSYDLVICREVFEHLTILEIKKAVSELCRISSKFIYLTTRFHPKPVSIFDTTTEFEVDPTHITCLNQNLLRMMFILEGYKSRPDLEKKMDWLNKKRVLVYEKK